MCIRDRSNNGTITRPAHIYGDAGGGPTSAPIASTTITVDATPGFYTATFNTPVTVTGTYYIGYENSPDGVISNLQSGASGTGFYRGTGNWSQSNLVQRPSWRVNCTSQVANLTPAMSVTGLPQLGSSYSPAVSDAAANSFAVFVSGLSDQSNGGVPLPIALPGAPGCDLLVSAETMTVEILDAQGDAQSTMTIPNSQALTGLSVFHQWAIWDPSVNNLSIVMSDAAVATVGN